MSQVSVVIPTYNRADLIVETLESVLSQTYQPSTVIVVDDGSTDSTQQVLEPYHSHPKVRVISKQNGGSASARNAGLLLATSEYVSFLDSDDLWLPSKLERQIDVLKQSGGAWVFSDAEFFRSQDGKSLGLSSKLGLLPHRGYVAHKLILGNFIPSPSPLVRRNVFIELGGFDEVCKTAEDWGMWLRIAAQYPVEYIPAPLVRYRVHTKSKTTVLTDDPIIGFKGRMLVLSRAVEANPEVYKGDEKRAIAAELVRTSRALANYGRLREARKMLAKAVRVDPLNINAYIFGIAAILGENNYAMLKRTYNHLQSELRLSSNHPSV